MSEKFYELSKDLASGMSRRKAFWRFGAGLGGAALGLLTGKKANAEGIGEFCDRLCRENDDFKFNNHGQCVSTCVQEFRFNQT